MASERVVGTKNSAYFRVDMMALSLQKRDGYFNLVKVISVAAE